MHKVLRCMLLTTGLVVTFFSALPEPEPPQAAPGRVAVPTDASMGAELAVTIVPACLGIDSLVLR